jgi:hypothetical protein
MITVRTTENIFPNGQILNTPHAGEIGRPELKQDKNGDVTGYVTVDRYFSKLRETVKRKYRERIDSRL